MELPDTLLWSWGPGESRLALLSRGEPLELLIERPALWQGSLFLGRVTAVDKGLDGAFVDLGIGGRPGFLPGARVQGLAEGLAVTVRVRAEARGGKGPLLAMEAAEAGGRAAPALLRRSHAVERLLAAHPTICRVLVDDAATLAEARSLCPGVTVERGVLPLDMDEVFEAALGPEVALPSGGRLLIETTAALTAIDVDSGAGSAAQANAEAVAAIARQLRLRAIGGQVVVDFVSGKAKGALHALARGLKSAVAGDPVPTHVFGVTALGLVELTRERRRVPLAELVCRHDFGPSAETAALAALRRLLAEVTARPGLLPVLVAAPDLTAALARLPGAVTETERRLGRPLVVRSEPGRQLQDITIEDGITAP